MWTVEVSNTHATAGASGELSSKPTSKSGAGSYRLVVLCGDLGGEKGGRKSRRYAEQARRTTRRDLLLALPKVLLSFIQRVVGINQAIRGAKGVWKGESGESRVDTSRKMYVEDPRDVNPSTMMARDM
jgi:hypothetical protein